jgi:hypothetical protein
MIGELDLVEVSAQETEEAVVEGETCGAGIIAATLFGIVPTGIVDAPDADESTPTELPLSRQCRSRGIERSERAMLNAIKYLVSASQNDTTKSSCHSLMT